MSGNTLASIGVGIVFAAAVIFSGGTAATALFAFSIGATLTGAIMGPDGPKDNGALRPDELQINQSAEDAIVPVIFGTTRVAANYIFVGFDDFESEAIKQEQEGGKGGGGSSSQTVGYRYFFPLHYGICMGEIDRLRRVLGSPGYDVMAEFDDEGLGFTGGNPETFDVWFTKEQGDQTYREGGSCTFYPGSSNQGSNANTEDTNHRSVCWIRFDRYRVDGSPAPRSLLFEITRIPKVLDDEGDPIPAFPRRASLTSTDAEYLDANPAAVAWELLTNKEWGKGMDAEELDMESFRDAAVYFAQARIGLSTAMGKTSLGQFMARLREVFGLWVWDDGQRLRARCIYDRSTAYSPRPRIHADDVIGSPNFNRPSLSATYNEIRLEFTNRENNWQSEVATAMDLAHVETVQGIRAQTVDGAEIGTRRAAELLAHTMLRQMAYPSAAATMKLRRTYSGLQPGHFIEFLWDEWRQNGMATTFWRVIDIEDDDQGTEGITVTLMEDLYATALDGELADGDFTAPVPTIDEDIPLSNSDLALADLTGNRPVGSLRPVILWEPNTWVTNGTRKVMVAPTREFNYVQSVTLAWRNYGQSQTFPLGTNAWMPINGRLLGNIVAGWPRISRQAMHEFQIELFYEKNATKFEAATGLVQDDSDHFSALTSGTDALMLIGNEIFRVGFAEETAPGIMTVRTYLRGELGSVKENHAINAPVVFFQRFGPSAFQNAVNMPTETKAVVHLTANTINSRFDYDTTSDQAPADGLGYLFSGESIRPFCPELISAQRTGTVWTLRLRPRMWGAGAGYRQNLEDDFKAYVTQLTSLSLRFQKTSGGPDVIVPADGYTTPPFTMPASISVDWINWRPDDGTALGGILTVQITFDANPASLTLWAVRGSMLSSSTLVIPTPP